jgi:hypothetical protein
MPVLSTGNTFTAAEQITSTKLNNIANAADFTNTSGVAIDSASTTGTCVNGGGLEVTSGGQLQVKDDDIDFVKLSDDAALTGGRFGIMNIVYPIGSVFIGVVSTNPDTLLFGGTGLTSWSAFGAGRVLVGQKSSDADFDTAEEEGGSKVPALLSHTHNTPTGMLTGNAGSGASGYDGGSFYNPIGNSAQTTTAASSGDQNNGNLQPYIVVYMWKRVSL